MNLRKQLKLISVAMIAAIITMSLLVWPSGPAYQGQSISKWFYRVRKFDSPPHPDKDKEAFRAMGREAVPFLVSQLEAAPSPRVKACLSSLSQTASEIYRQRKEMWQNRAAYLLGEIGPAAKSAETNLIQAAASGNWALRGQAAVALMKIREQPPDALIEKLRDMSDWKAWYENAMMVASFGFGAEAAVPILLDALQQSNNIIQAHALIALGMIARQPDNCIPAILPFVTSPNVSDRQKAMFALLAFGTDARSAEKVIQGALNDSDPWVRKLAQSAMKTLKQIESSKSRAGTDEAGGAANRSQP